MPCIYKKCVPDLWYGYMDTHSCFPNVMQRGKTFVTSCLLGWHGNLSKRVYSRRKEFPSQFNSLTLRAPITTAADDIHKYFFIVFQRK